MNGKPLLLDSSMPKPAENRSDSAMIFANSCDVEVRVSIFAESSKHVQKT